MTVYRQSKFTEDLSGDELPLEIIELFSPTEPKDSTLKTLSRTVCKALKSRMKTVRRQVRRHWQGKRSGGIVERHLYQGVDTERRAFEQRLWLRCRALGWPLPGDNGEGPSVVPVIIADKRSGSEQWSPSEVDMEELSRLKLEDEQGQGPGPQSIEEELLPYELIDRDHCEACERKFRQGVRDGKRTAK